MLVDLSIKDFAKIVTASKPVVPVGSYVTALSGLVGVSLLEMSVNSAFGHPPGEKDPEFFKNAKSLLSKLHEELSICIEKNAVAYQDVLDAYKLPKSTPEEVVERKAKVQAAALSAIKVPLKISETCLAALDPGIAMLPKVKRGVLGDLEIGLLMLKTGIEGALAAARINLSLIHEVTLAKKFHAKINELQVKFDALAAALKQA